MSDGSPEPRHALPERPSIAVRRASSASATRSRAACARRVVACVSGPLIGTTGSVTLRGIGRWPKIFVVRGPSPKHDSLTSWPRRDDS